MELFLDTANIEEIRTAASWGIIDGVTTNPTLLSREKGAFEDIIKEIISIIDGPISVEAVSTCSDELIAEAKNMARLSDNVAVKIPMGVEGLKAVKSLSGDDVKTNMTLIFSANQAMLAAKAGATYASLFVGRLDDIGHDGMREARDMVQIYKAQEIRTRVIVASIRHPVHVLEAAKIGAHVATVPFSVLRQMMNHPLTDAGIKRFLTDWKKFKGKDE
ncbi:MAG: fructose-6-phosphate aldolase [Candidatus Altiarchaeota archaeon]|nr:fructose-6-phosphate aldolase [Candidatus Altiarchaeota archaeon]